MVCRSLAETMLDSTTTLDDVLYSSIEPYDSGMLQVTDLHSIAWEKSGNPDGIPVVVIHGGPGGGGQPAYRQYFDPAKFNIIQFDQRGCGQSTPHAELRDNTTQAMVADIEALRVSFGVEQWHVFGGSWGSTLSLIYAQTYPDRVRSLILRGIFMCRKSELQWFYQDGASHIFPDAFEPYREHIPKAEQGEPHRSILRSPDERRRSKCAEPQQKQWTRWEMATSRLFPRPESYLGESRGFGFRSGLCAHRMPLLHQRNLRRRSPHLEPRSSHRTHIPTVIVQGRYDVVCPTRSAWELHKALPQIAT